MGKVIDNDDLKYVKNSLKNVPTSDQEWCEDLVDYVEMSASNNDDEFFYDMVEMIRFINEPGTLAYTDENRRIYLSAPGIIGKNILPWDFTYAHECLHQLWETFEVKKEIESKGIEYNHDLLNIASDCVINDYLRELRGKTPPNGIIFPETIKAEFGVDYNRQEDTQFSLYMKLLKSGKRPSSNMSKMANPQQGKGSQSNQSRQGGQSGQSGQGGQQGGQSGQGGKSIDDMSKDEAKESAEADAQRAQDAADKAKAEKGAGSKEAKDAQAAADKARAAADKAKRARSENGAKKAAKEARQAAEEAAKAAGIDHDQAGGGWGSGTYTGGTEAEKDLDNLERKEIDKITKRAEGYIKKAKGRISGEFGKFIRKCKVSAELRESGLAVTVNKAKANWKKLTYNAIDAYINNQVFQKKREWKSTYSRPKRGSGIVRMGDPIEMGRIPKEDKLDIPIGFYIDKSGSMYSTIDRASKAMYSIAQDIKKDWYHEKIIGEMDFSFHAFDTKMHELKVGQVPPASNDNMTLADILGFIASRPKKDLINIIITDGQYDINDAQMAAYFKTYDGIMIMVIDNVNAKMKALEQKFKGKFVYVQADNDFTL